jgi:MinD superfamily P-loop ATPase
MELTILSGKGGTGKTMIAVAIAALSGIAVKADCDVDAPNLYLYYGGDDIKKESFFAGKKAVIDSRFCTQCGICEEVCRFGAIRGFSVDAINCEGCGACALVCPEKAVAMKPQKNADVYLTRTPGGMLSRARMMTGSDGSGKLITQLRQNARRFAEEDALVIIDGSPGIGCPVISSITAADMVLLVAEPTLSGLADLKRVAELCRHFGVRTLACVNKWDINAAITCEIEAFCLEQDIMLIGKIPFDEMVRKSVNELRPITEYADSVAGIAVRQMWEKLSDIITAQRRTQMELGGGDAPA